MKGNTLNVELKPMSLKDAREWHGLNQSELGKLVEMPQQYISHLETGYRTPTLTTLKKLAKALDCLITITPKGEVKYHLPE
jgi:transcriptional regulator with XRE-family HTH domain